jgi:hypothetical protein
MRTASVVADGTRTPAVRRPRARLPGAHSQGATLDGLRQNLREVIEVPLAEGEPTRETGFVGVQIIQVAQA